MENKIYDMLPSFSEAVENEEISDIQLNLVMSTVKNYLISLSGKMKQYFPYEDDSHAGNDWIKNPFTNHHDNELTTTLDDELIELANDRGLQVIFKNCESLPAFWNSIRQEYPDLSDSAQTCLTTFASTYRCETAFSSMTII